MQKTDKSKYSRRIFYLTVHELKQLRALHQSIHVNREVAFSKSKIIRIIIAAYVQNYPKSKQDKIVDSSLKAKLICERLLVEQLTKVTVDIPNELIEVLFQKFDKLSMRKGLQILIKKALVDVSLFYRQYIKCL